MTERLVTDLKANSLLEYNLELTENQKEQLQNVISTKGQEAVENYLANLDQDERTKLAYGLVREKTTEIADAVLSSIGQEINRGAIINCRAVQANSKGDKFDEILLRKTKSSGDITIPTDCVLISTNCVEVIKASCQEAAEGETADEEEAGEEAESTAETKPKKARKKKK